MLYPSCRECNTLLGSKHLATYGERLLFLFGKYGKSIDRNEALWHESEIAELGATLQSVVMRRHRIVSRHIRKIRAIESRILEVDEG